MTYNEASAAERRLAELATSLHKVAQGGGELTEHQLAVELANALCGYLPEALGHKYRRWALEALDHASLTLMRFVDQCELEVAGLCILIWDPTTMPFHARLHLAEDASGIAKAICKAGEVDSSTGKIVRLAWGSDAAAHYADSLNQRIDSIVWKYEVELTDAPDS